MPKQKELRVHLDFDKEAKCWYVARSDIPGLRLEADNPMDLVRKIVECAPELIELNRAAIEQQDRQKRVARPARRGSGGMSIRPVFDSPLELQYA